MAKVYSFGELDVSHINEMNVPINVFLEQYTYKNFTEDYQYSPYEDFDGDYDETIEIIKDDDIVYVLSAGNFMPRREYVGTNAYRFMSTDKQELVNIVNKYITPLYEQAVLNLKNDSHNYYWEQNRDESTKKQLGE